MAKKDSVAVVDQPTDYTAEEIRNHPEPAPLAESNGKKTRAPSKTRHISAVRAQKVENAISLFRMASESQDGTMKNAATLLATKMLDEVFKLDDEIAKLQAAD